MYAHQRAVAIEWMNRAVEIARRPPYEQPERWKAWEARIERVKASEEGVYTAAIRYSLMPKLTSLSSASATTRPTWARRPSSGRRATSPPDGAWPASVGAIDADILPVPPVDPSTGESYRMEHRDGRLFIYSIGPNRQDEHGEYNAKRWEKGWADDVGAIGWDVDRRRQPAPASQDESGNETPGAP